MPQKKTQAAASTGGTRARSTETKEPEVEEWVLTVNRQTGALIKIERLGKSGKREAVTLEQFGQEFMKRAMDAFKATNPAPQTSNEQGPTGPSMGWPYGPY